MRVPGRGTVLLLRERGHVSTDASGTSPLLFSNSSICLEVEGNSMLGHTSQFQRNI